jgi:hypothetical protein
LELADEGLRVVREEGGTEGGQAWFSLYEECEAITGELVDGVRVHVCGLFTVKEQRGTLLAPAARGLDG